jgi:hypothetical protein
VFNETFIAATPLKGKGSPLAKAQQAAASPAKLSSRPLLPPATPAPNETPASKLRRNAALLATKAIDFVTRKFGTLNQEQLIRDAKHTESLIAIDYTSPAQSVRKNSGKIVVAALEKPVKQASIDADPFAPPSTVRKRRIISKIASPATSKGPESKCASPSKAAASTELPPLPPSTTKKRKAQQAEVITAEVSKSPLKASMPIPALSAAANTPKVKTAIVEFVAPQSIARTSKRPRRSLDSSVFEESSNVLATPVARRQTALDMTCTPNMSQASGTASFPGPHSIYIASRPSVTLIAPSAPLPVKEPVSAAPVAPNVPKIPIVAPVTGQTAEGSMQIPPSAPKRTPIRVQPARTPTRPKAVIPTLGDYSTSKRVSVIEVAKAHLASTAPALMTGSATTKPNNSTASLTATPSVPVAATPKVESWTSKFFTGEKPTIAASITASNVTIKPLDTSKLISAPVIPVANVPNVPKFPLNLANISNISSLAKASATQQQQQQHDASAKPVALSKPPNQQHPANAFPPESPLSRAKRIDSENALKEQQIQSQMASKADRLKQAMGQLRSSDELKAVVNVEEAPNQEAIRVKAEPVVIIEGSEAEGLVDTATTAAAIATTTVTGIAPPISSSKLPVKPRAPVLPSPKIPSRLAEAFSGIDSELPPIDIGLVDDEQVLQRVLANKEDAVKTQQATASKAANVKSLLAKPAIPAVAPSIAKPVLLAHQPSSNPLHKTAVMNSAATRTKIIPLDTTVMVVKPATSAPSIALKSPGKIGTSPGLPEIYSRYMHMQVLLYSSIVVTMSWSDQRAMEKKTVRLGP